MPTDGALSVGIVRCSKNPVDAREKNIQQRAKSLSLAGALYVTVMSKVKYVAFFTYVYFVLLNKEVARMTFKVA